MKTLLFILLFNMSCTIGQITSGAVTYGKTGIYTLKGERITDFSKPLPKGTYISVEYGKVKNIFKVK